MFRIDLKGLKRSNADLNALTKSEETETLKPKIRLNKHSTKCMNIKNVSNKHCFCKAIYRDTIELLHFNSDKSIQSISCQDLEMTKRDCVSNINCKTNHNLLKSPS